QAVRRAVVPRLAQSRNSASVNVRLREIERTVSDRRPRDRQRQGQAQRVRQELVESNRRREVDIPLGEKRRLFSEQAKVRIFVTEVQTEIDEVRSVERHAELTSEARRVYLLVQPKVINPHFQRIARQDARRADSAAQANDPDRELLHRGEIGS